jgi:hypothetical protein
MGQVAAVVAAVLIGLILLDRVAVWMERRGWIYWRKEKRADGPGGGGTAGLLTEFQQLVEPQVRHVIQDREERRLVRLSHSADGPDGKRPDAGE